MSQAVDLGGLGDRTPRGIAGAFSRAIRAGDLAPGDRLPTVRVLAADLGVSPATVSAAWQALRRTGLVVSRGRSGTFVRDTPTPWLSPRQRGLVGAGRDGLRLDLSRGTPDPRLLPSLGPALRRVSERAGTLAYQDEPVLPALREVLRASWPYDAESITVVDGATDGIARTLEQVVSYGDRVVLESPGFPPFFDLVEVLGGEVVPVELDAHGVRPDALREALRTEPVAVVLQPRAHNPTGVAMGAERAEELVSVLTRAATATGRMPWVLEDDHSAGISAAPAVTLGTRLPDRVVHVRSYSKSHGPDLRIAALSGPAELIDAVVARRMLGPAWTSRMLQTILLDLLTSAAAMDEVAEARRQYFARQRTVVEQLARHGLALAPPDGINLWLEVADERAALLHLAASGIRAAGGTAFWAGGADGTAGAPYLRLTTGLVAAADAPDVAAALAAATRAR
ncbi:aminotransferase class I/II-fold pyridoxal phosphate-dependent enzyme [Nocardioides sp. zg-536]|uniref:Aminotransferase class I/II-fold pyridoxal phosphate-dependent enzyme n=1 Tax=Nocardioides faecalis TaxID=2803858 RepID=A0A938Y4I7_9ACTN|nr:aminotransferase class I/II-fold pyridoxal phosphate-dependent enzyme [Nocardioides faecalis]MBM9459873.1 aminotransferase class I/II-fold pyridoxal phosphate-dependent enzyme [Nocardioides faecalis]QVI58891.1 aminotransferase class I/II-fold pyridoxal phosphate-dependent enzyme [Nocardioides faecalis]